MWGWTFRCSRVRVFEFFYALWLVVIIIPSRGARALLRRPHGFLTRLRFNGIRKKKLAINKERVYMCGIFIYIILYRETVKRFFCFELDFFRFFVCSRNGRRSCISPYGRVLRQSDVLSSRLVGRSCCIGWRAPWAFVYDDLLYVIYHFFFLNIQIIWYILQL